MVKTKEINAHVPLVLTGYTLFALLVIAVILSTVIPWGRMLFEPQLIRYNVILYLAALTIGSLLPVVLGYMIGGETIRSKSKLSHHFNGVLFGLLAYWIMSILSILGFLPYDLSPDVRIILVNLLPSVGVAVVSVILAIAHVRSRQAKRDIIEYKPYSIMLIGCIIFISGWSLVEDVLAHTANWLSLVSLLATIAIGILSYVTLRKSKLNVQNKVTWSVVSVSVASLAAFVLSLLTSSVSSYIETMPTMEYQVAVAIIGLIIGLAGWGAYWWVQVKFLSKK